ncbi:hypothetical protein D9V86_06585 [Bacteroidetes/Chlorobi group bacterium ChocPot_Mid]|nr:MAG: hypothetical protein D9V86_06585 [Bacteroidetes/Chlorobi group bacterium ChocPot_Mid]
MLSIMRKSMRTIIMVILLLVIIMSLVFSQETKNDELNIKSVSIKTSAQCDLCKDRIEKNLSKQKGILNVNLIVETAMCEVKYDSTLTSPDDIRKEITFIGYDADELKANKRAYSKLPKCCKKPEDR